MSSSLRDMPILFVGARVVGRHCLEAILEAGAVVGLLHLDDTKAGATVAHTSFAGLIAEHGLNARSFASLSGEEGRSHLAWAEPLRPQLGIVVGVSQLLSPEFLALPAKGFIGMHPTLLPQGRGRAPIPWAIILGLEETGVTLFYADSGADTGDILAQARVPIRDDDTASTLGARTDAVAAQLLRDNLPRLANGTAPRARQSNAGASEWPRRRPEDGVIDWGRDATALYNWIRALTHPYPGAFTLLGDERLYVWSAKRSCAPLTGAPGEVMMVDAEGALIATGRGLLRATSVQWEGGPEASPLAAGLEAGMRLGARA